MSITRRHRHLHHRTSTVTTAFAFLLFATASALSYTHLGDRNESKEKLRWGTSGASTSAELKTVVITRRRLGGPGSWPPSCRSKCGRCSPCRPVHVPIHPGMSMPLEYYPEAWRCKCGNTLFMP